MGPNDAVRAELQKAAGEAQLAFWKAKADRLAKTPEQAAGRLPMGLGSGFSPHVNPENVYQTVEASIVFDFFFRGGRANHSSDRPADVQIILAGGKLKEKDARKEEEEEESVWIVGIAAHLIRGCNGGHNLIISPDGY